MTEHSYADVPESPGDRYRAVERVWRVARNPERPSARSVVFLIFLFALPVAMLPATRGFFVRIPPLPRAWWTVYLVLLFGAVAVVFRVFGYSRRMRRSTFWCLAAPIVLLGGWQIMTLFWNGQDTYVRWYSLLQSMSMCAAVVGAVLLCSGLSWESRIRVGAALTVLVAFIVMVYAGLSFLFPSLRPSYAWMDRTAAGLGFIRVFGPLGRSTTLNFVIVPALGFSLGMVFMRTPWRFLWLVLTVFLVGCVIATGSRGGLLCLVTFGFVLVVLGKLRAMLILLPLAGLLVGVVGVVGVPERFKSLEDNARINTYRTALATYASSPRNIIFGAGHGALYTKLHDDSVRKLLGEDRWYLLDHNTKFGYSLRNSHSAILRSLVETGFPGLLLVLVPLVWLGLRPLSGVFRAAQQPDRMLLRSALAGCIAVVPYMMVEEFFISAFWVIVIWTMFVVCVAEGVDERTPVAQHHADSVVR